MNNISRYLDVIYCDDIRNEVGNKFSYMGIYTRELNIPSVPLLLPKLCIVVKVVSDINDPIESVVVRVVMLKEHKEIELITTDSLTMPSSTELQGRDNDSTCVLTQMQFVLSPFQIDEESTLRVKATTEREELLGVALRLRVVSPPTPPTIQ